MRARVRVLIGALLVMEGEQILGIVTERDLARKVDLLGRSSKDTRVKDIMTSNVMYVSPETTNEQCMALMTERASRYSRMASACANRPAATCAARR